MDYIERLGRFEITIGFLTVFLNIILARYLSRPPTFEHIGIVEYFLGFDLTVFMFSMGLFFIGALSAHAWRNNVYAPPVLSTLLLLKGHLSVTCRGISICYFDVYEGYLIAGLGLALFAYLTVIMWRNRREVQNLLESHEGRKFRDLKLAFLIGWLHFTLFLPVNLAIRDPQLFADYSFTIWFIISSMGLLPAAAVPVWLFFRYKLKSPILVQLLWIVFWLVLLSRVIENAPLGTHWYPIAYTVPGPDYALAWVPALSLGLLCSTIEYRLRESPPQLFTRFKNKLSLDL